MSSVTINKIAYATNNRNGLLVLRQLRMLNVDIEYLILHPTEKGCYQEEIIEASGTQKCNVIIWQPGCMDIICRQLAANPVGMLFSCNFGYLIPPEVLSLFTLPINLHMSHLPYNKGAFPNVWPILDGTPAGVTLHVMSEKFDDGPIIFQKEVEVTFRDTGESLYEKLVQASVELVKDSFLNIVNGNFSCKENRGGTYHSEKEFFSLLKLDLDKNYTAQELINLIRALTFPPFRNLFCEHDGQNFFLELTIYNETTHNVMSLGRSIDENN